MNHRCRDCGEHITGERVNRCPACNSMYLIPLDANVEGSSRRAELYGDTRQITLGERFYCAFLGFLLGGLTFIIWLIEVLVVSALFQGGPALQSFEAGIKLSVAIGLVLGLTGFVSGADRLANYMGMLWGTGDAATPSDRPDKPLRRIFFVLRFALLAGGILAFIYYMGVR